MKKLKKKPASVVITFNRGEEVDPSDVASSLRKLGLVVRNKITEDYISMRIALK